MTYMIAQNGIDDGERQRILEHPGLNLTDSEKQAFFNLNSLGVRLSRSVEQSRNENKV